ncbi:MAG TPA: heat-inducible transcriptional repressor HrcA [Solirubrobacterales bacterium]|jgi:heat-inducible transcriptional repressor|nr:heat-inducible transcriptional repressor HrcA [Solirubrobacterales bacterium]
MLTERQQAILGLVVERYVSEGRPVGSKAIATKPEIDWSASTVRAELASLEREGFLTHPHTSAGRVPTDSGYRFYVEELLASEERLPVLPQKELGLSRMRREVDEAIRDTTAALSRITDLVALVSAPPLATATIHRVEALRLQPRSVMVVVIASNGGVTKRVFSFPAAVDPGLVEWAGSYLNERLAGLGLGAHMVAARLDDSELSATERGFIAEIESVFVNLGESAEDTLYVDGTARLLTEEHSADLPHVEELLRALERRVNLLRTLRSALDERSVFVWIGAENPQPELRSVSVVGANYGLGYRNLGAVGVIGPLRMDYGTAIASVRQAAGQLSRLFDTVYGE